MDTHESIEAQRRIAGGLEAVLRADDLFDPVRLVIDPRSGCPACPVPMGVFTASSWNLYIPEDQPDSVQLMVTPREVDPANHDAADRWMAYYGKPRLARFAIFEIEMYKRMDVTVGGAEARVVHPFRAHEGVLCREASAMEGELRRACERMSGASPAEVRAVGVDPYGLDVKVRFGVMRLEFDGRAGDAERAREAMLRRLGQ